MIKMIKWTDKLEGSTRMAKDDEDWVWLKSTDELRTYGHVARSPDHNINPLLKDMEFHSPWIIHMES